MKNTTLDLSSLPLPDVIETLDYEGIYDFVSSMFLILWAQKRVLKPELPEINVLNLETDPVAVAIEAWATYIVVMRARVNDTAKALMLSSTTGTDLDNFAADFNLSRRQIGTDDGGNPIYESDEEFRLRRALAPDGYAAAGPENAYKFFALSADGSIKQVEAVKGEANRCDIILLGRDGDGTVATEVITKVYQALSPKVTRPLTDTVYVRSAAIVAQPIVVHITVGSGPDKAAIAAKAKSSIEAYARSRSAIGRVLHVSGLVAAAHNGNALENATVIEPAMDIDPGKFGSVYVPTVTIEVI